MAHRVYGVLLAEWNDLEAAAEHLRQAEQLARAIGNVDVLSGALRGLALLKRRQNDPVSAAQALAQAQQLDLRYALPHFIRACNAAAYVELALGQKDVATAVHWATQIHLPADASPFFPRLFLTPVRILLAQGQRVAAFGRLAALQRQAEQAGWQWGLVEVRALQALAAPDSETALTCLRAALELAEPEGYVRTFVDKGAAMAALLRRAAARGIMPAYVEKLLAGYDALPFPIDAFRLEKGVVRQAAILSPQAVESLSERELEVLTLLVQGRSNAEIAEKLTVSVNTVKTHLQHIFDKLGVHDRRTAVARARALEIISP